VNQKIENAADARCHDGDPEEDRENRHAPVALGRE
jgi:hypothetical protein